MKLVENMMLLIHQKIMYLIDKELISKAWKRVKSTDAKIGERSAALAVTGLMKIKAGIGKISGGGVIKSASLKNSKNENISKAAQVALKAAKRAIKSNNSKKPFKFRVTPVPKTGGILPFLIPLIAGLSAIGSLAGGIAAVANAVNSTKNAQLNENERHNKRMEAISVGKKATGEGLYLKPYKTGLGLYLKPQPKNH